MTDRITTPFGAASTADEVIAGVDLTGRRAVVTGGASGLGRETARALASAAAEVTIAGRNLEAAAEAADEITRTTDNPKVSAALLDLADLSSVARFAKDWAGPLHILVDNAGVMASPELRTPEGRELQFATNHLGHFALTVGLHDALRAAGNARVVVVSSVGHVNGPVRFDDIDFTHEPYDPWLAYAQSWTASRSTRSTPAVSGRRTSPATSAPLPRRWTPPGRAACRRRASPRGPRPRSCSPRHPSSRA
jgi:NAD(P)-dependent dehydrogenase (short-subunit alcohol dehydrogenase family)